MSDRKAISKKVRFDVFKRDSFQCQYCGGKAPEVLLVIDHIKAVALGGDNHISNLVTACQPCNAGKGAHPLSDNSTVEKQRRQLEELNERRNQLAMLLDWREGLEKLEGEQADALLEALTKVSGFGPNKTGFELLHKWTKKYGFAEVLEGIDAAFDRHYRRDPDPCKVDPTWETAFNAIPKAIWYRRAVSEQPHLKDLFYIRGILRNRLHYVNEREVMKLLGDAYLSGFDIPELKELAKTTRNWTSFVEEINDFFIEHGRCGENS